VAVESIREVARSYVTAYPDGRSGSPRSRRRTPARESPPGRRRTSCGRWPRRR